jgi:hypothetical protein
MTLCSGHSLAVWATTGVASARREGSTAVADLAYAVLLIGVFALLALMLRGLERL